MGDLVLSPTFGLLALPSLAEGLGSLMDFAGSAHMYNRSQSAGEADLRALRSDWLALGQDLRLAVDLVGEDLGSSE